MRPTKNRVLHEAAMLLGLIGMRDRLRCPKCRAVGTWKPHGGWWEDGAQRRWLCKWCGYYYNPAHPKITKCVPGETSWQPAPRGQILPPTPAEAVGEKVWPWLG